MRRDEALHERIRVAEAERRVDVGVDLRPLNRPGSPVYVMWKNAAPTFGLAAIVVVVWLAADWIWAMAALASGVILLLTVVNMMVMTRVRRRALALALNDVAGWSSLWDQGVLSLRLPAEKGSECLSPHGDWRGFAIRNLPARRRVEVE